MHACQWLAHMWVTRRNFFHCVCSLERVYKREPTIVYAWTPANESGHWDVADSVEPNRPSPWWLDLAGEASYSDAARSHDWQSYKQGKSGGFESCDRPIVRKHPNSVKIGNVLSHVNMKFDGWPWKTIGHLSFAVSSSVQHFIAIEEFKLELQSGNAQLGSNSTIFRAGRPWNLTDDLEKTIGHLFYATSSFLHHLVAICELKLEL